ncbi:hypothetical protein WH96_04055 [Kiloniella spongiae]|uniref:DUF2249 domain-containing protein n=1 Tax=Kiloniella spongiae TaxID=1489064 RepID=A0A0H2MHA3_9PROT|nr:hypothetical protein [Kiloniella spongiae]KLN61551.1 hypothetical protein WH96_04055 [Kiloniella spongiae]
MDNKQTSDDDSANCHYLRVEEIIAEGRIPVDVVIDALFASQKESQVMLQSNFDPIPLRLKLTQLGCIIDRKENADGWLFHIYRDQTSIKKEKTTNTAKAIFSFTGDIITINVRAFRYPDDFLEVLRFMDTSLDADCFGVEINRFPDKFRDVLSERGWRCISGTKVSNNACHTNCDSHSDQVDDYQVLLLEKE